jgi:hypothetical protein
MKTLLIGGDWDHVGGRPSYLVSQVQGVDTINGGYLEDLRSMDFDDVEALIWMPNISNEEEKILPSIKKEYPSLLLVQSKCKRSYSNFEITRRLLSSHSCLGLIVGEDKLFSVVDPLGNTWCAPTNIKEALNVVLSQLEKYKHMTRVRSTKVDTEISYKLEESFLDTVQKTAKVFDNLVQALNPERFLGNASTRCAHGFPSFKSEGDWCVVTRRNIDKSVIADGGFVPARFLDGGVQYQGDHKPSVDTPIQLKLYEKYMNVKYIVHGHVYVKDAPFTASHIPCGYLEEVDEILAVQPDLLASNFCVNLIGHGCLILAKDVSYFEEVEFISRPIGETP